MSQENAELVSRALAAAPADLEPLFSIMDDHVEWDYVGAFPEVVTYHGPKQVREFFGQWTGAFEDFGFEAEEVLDAGESVLALVHQWGQGRETGARVENRTWQVFTLRGGKVVHCRGYDTKDEALEAAGLTDQERPHEIAQLAHRVIDALNRRDLAGFLALMDAEVEAGPRFGSIEGSFHGHDGLRRWWNAFLETWPDVATEIAGLHVVEDLSLGTLHLRGHGAGSKFPSEWTVSNAARWRGGKCVWWANFSSRAEALEAAGLSEQDVRG